jgi:hypothetical protein
MKATAMKTTSLFAMLIACAVSSWAAEPAPDASSPGGRSSVTDDRPARIGSLIQRLSDQEIADVMRIATTNGGTPWLLNATPSQLGIFQSVEAYCIPATTNQELRRGSLVSAWRRQAPEAAASWQPWTLQWRGEYAQVSIPGRDFDRVGGEQDVNRPFGVSGKFSDEELVGVVRFIRSKPVFERDGERTAIESGWAILSVSRMEPESLRLRRIVTPTDDCVAVKLRKDDWSGQVIILGKQGAGWIILEVGSWIV